MKSMSLPEVVEYIKTVAVVNDQVDQGVLEKSQNELDEYRLFHARRFWRSLQLMQKWGPTGEVRQILELGAMPYYFTALVNHCFSGVQVTGVNVRAGIWEDSAKAGPSLESVTLKHGANRQDNIPIQVFNIETTRFPFPDSTFDWVLCMEIIEHLAYSPTNMLAEAHRVLKPGGRILLSTPNAIDLRKTVNMLINRSSAFPYSGYGIYGRHNREFTLEELRSLTAACGFRVVDAWLENITLRLHYSPLKQWFFKFLTFWTGLPLPYLKNKRECIFLIAESTGRPVFSYPSNFYLFPHLYPENPHRFG
jgi:SAM-dependent methyltransferase